VRERRRWLYLLNDACSIADIELFSSMVICCALACVVTWALDRQIGTKTFGAPESFPA
jgi:hypothetical protein